MQWTKILTECRKAGIAGLSALAAALAAGIIPGKWTPLVVAILGAATAYGITFAVPNVPPLPEYFEYVDDGEDLNA